MNASFRYNKLKGCLLKYSNVMAIGLARPSGRSWLDSIQGGRHILTSSGCIASVFSNGGPLWELVYITACQSGVPGKY